jgi:hypothetical protein
MRPTSRAQTINLTVIGIIIVLEILVAYLSNLDFRLSTFAVGTMIVLVVTLVKIEWMLPVLVFSLYLMGLSLGGLELPTGGNLRVYHFVAAFLIVRWLYFVLVTGYKRFFLPNAIVAPSLAFLGWMTLSIGWSPDFQFAAYRWVKVALNVLGALMFINISKYKSKHDQALWYWVYCAALGGVVFYYCFISMGTPDTDYLITHQSIIAEMMNVCMFMSIGMAILTRRTFLRWFSIFTAIFAITVTATTGRRAGFMGLSAGLIVFVIMGIFNSRVGKKFPITLTLCFLIIVAAVSYQISQMESFVIPAFGREFDLLNLSQTDTFAWRIDTIKAGWNIVNENSAWLWGMGVGAWEYLQEEAMGSTWARFIHNFYFNWFFQYGIIGMVILGWLIVRITQPILQAYKWVKDNRTRWFLNCMVSIYAAMGVHGLVSVEEANSYIWILFASTAVFMDYLKEQHDKNLPFNVNL